MPENMGRVVVAVGAEGLADDGSLRVMDRSAAERTAVPADTPAPSRMAAVVSGTVDRAEGRRGQRDEEPGPMADGGGNALAADQARADEVVGVSSMES